MDVFNRKVLRTVNKEPLSTIDDKILRVIDYSSLSNEGIEKVIRHPLSIPRFRVYVLNEDESISFEIPQEDIIIGSSTYNETYQQGVRKTLSLSLVNIDGKYTPSINGLWLQTKFRLDVGIEYKNIVKWYQKGVFVMSNPTLTRNTSDKKITLQLVDKFQRLVGKTGILEYTYEIPVGSNIIETIRDILMLNFGNNFPIDSSDIIYDKVFENKITPHTLSKDPNGTLGDLVLGLATMLNSECFYNDYGNLVLLPIAEAGDDYKKSILWHYKESVDDKIDFLGQTLTYDFDNAINAVYVVGDNINGDIASGEVINNDPFSPMSVDYIGKRAFYLADSNIYSDELAQERALYELRKASILSTELSLQAYLVPFLSANSIIQIDDGFLNWTEERFLINSISFNIGSDSIMNISCANVNNLPFSSN